MYAFKTRIFGRVAVATLLSLGLTAGAVSVASATNSKASSHSSVTSHHSVAFQGIITALPAGGVTVVNSKGTSETFTIATTTKILRAANVNHAAVLAVNDRVEVHALASAPTAATSINILAVNANKSSAFKGVVTAFVAGSSVTVKNAKGTSETFTITTTTKLLGKSPLTLAMNDRVTVRALASAPTVATSINILGK